MADAYEADGGDTNDLNKEDFTNWLLANLEKTSKITVEESDILPPVNDLIAMYVVIMGQYAEFYARRIFRQSPIYSLADWAVLVSLFPDIEMKKTDVLRSAIMEKSSGNEVLKRLLKQGLITESPNPADHRSKLIKLTDAGKIAFTSVEQGIHNLSDLVVADLTAEEKSNLLNILMQLNTYHQPIFESADEAVLAERLLKYSTNS